MSCDKDAVYAVGAGAKKNVPQPLLTTSMKPGVVRRTHAVLPNMTHIIDQGANLKVMQPKGYSYTVALDVANVDVVDITSMKGRNDVFAVLYKGEAAAGLAVYSVTDAASTTKLDLQFPSGAYGVKAELRGEKGAEQALVLMGDGSLRCINLAKCGDGVVAYADVSEQAATTIENDLSPRDFAVSTDGKIAAAVSTEGTLMTFDAETLKPMCAWTPDEPSPVTFVRAVTAGFDDAEVKAHTVIAVHGEASPPSVSLFHIRNGAEGCWEAWKTQQITLANMGPVPMFEVACGGDVMAAAEKGTQHVVVLKLAPTTDNGKLVRNVAHFDCEKAMGDFVSLVVRSEKEGVRLSARRTEGVVFQDIPFDQIQALPSPSPSFDRGTAGNKNADELRAMVRTLEQENARLREENKELLARPPPSSLPHEIEDQLKQTTQLVDSTCRAMISRTNEMQSDVNDRMNRLEESLAAAYQLQKASLEQTKHQLAQTNAQAVRLIKESAERDSEQIKVLHVDVNKGLIEARKAADEFYNTLAVEVRTNRSREAEQLSEGLKQKVVSLLSEPGLARLKEMVANNAFMPDVYKDGEAIINDTVQDTLKGELKEHLSKTALVFLNNEREMLQKVTQDLKDKSEELLRNVVPSIAAELRAGFQKFGNEGYQRSVLQWQADAERRLRAVEQEGRKTIEEISKDPLGVKLGQLDMKRKIKRALEGEEFWSKGVQDIFAHGSSDVSEEAFAHIFECSPMPPDSMNARDSLSETRQLVALVRFADKLVSSLDKSQSNADSKLCYLDTLLSLMSTSPPAEQVQQAIYSLKTKAEVTNYWRNKWPNIGDLYSHKVQIAFNRIC